MILFLTASRLTDEMFIYIDVPDLSIPAPTKDWTIKRSPVAIRTSHHNLDSSCTPCPRLGLHHLLQMIFSHLGYVTHSSSLFMKHVYANILKYILGMFQEALEAKIGYWEWVLSASGVALVVITLLRGIYTPDTNISFSYTSIFWHLTTRYANPAHPAKMNK